MQILKQGIYRHYKGNLYEVTGIAKHSETGEELVVYKALYQSEGINLWVRPLDMFTAMVNVNGAEVKRFAFVE